MISVTQHGLLATTRPASDPINTAPSELTSTAADVNWAIHTTIGPAMHLCSTHIDCDLPLCHALMCGHCPGLMPVHWAGHIGQISFLAAVVISSLCFFPSSVWHLLMYMCILICLPVLSYSQKNPIAYARL